MHILKIKRNWTLWTLDIWYHAKNLLLILFCCALLYTNHEPVSECCIPSSINNQPFAVLVNFNLYLSFPLFFHHICEKKRNIPHINRLNPVARLLAVTHIAFRAMKENECFGCLIVWVKIFYNSDLSLNWEREKKSHFNTY